MNILVTGGAGFIGSNFVDLAMADPSRRVTVLDALTYAGTKENLEGHRKNERLRLIVGDVADPEAVRESLDGADLAVHFAAESFVDRSIEAAEPFVRTNVQGTLTLLTACRDAGVPMIQVSTDEVYGSIEDGAFTEESPLAPNNPYAATKAAADLLCRSFRATFGVDVRILRGTNAYGPRQHREKAIPVFIAAALATRPLPVYGDGANRREWLHVTDFARAVWTVVEQGEPGGVYNVGGGHETSNVDLAREICRLAGASEDLVSFVEDRPGHDLRYSMLWERIAALGWTPAVPFDEGLAGTVEWFRAHPERLEGSS
ncbi:MAG TPA: dTDP-glucose 4,6-dehydratase [Actinomycetota bacterium]